MEGKKERGDFGERIAQEYLSERGFFILQKKFYTAFGEIDIIAWDKSLGEVVFVEVKTRWSMRFGWPEEAVDAKKREKVQKSAAVFLSEKYPHKMPRYRFDIVSVLIDRTSRRAQVYHFKNVEMGAA